MSNRTTNPTPKGSFPGIKATPSKHPALAPAAPVITNAGDAVIAPRNVSTAGDYATHALIQPTGTAAPVTAASIVATLNNLALRQGR